MKCCTRPGLPRPRVLPRVCCCRRLDTKYVHTLRKGICVNMYNWRRLRLLTGERPAGSSKRAPQDYLNVNFKTRQISARKTPRRAWRQGWLAVCRNVIPVLTDWLPFQRPSWNSNFLILLPQTDTAYFHSWLSNSTAWRSWLSPLFLES
jgi:hypothetical protein